MLPYFLQLSEPLATLLILLLNKNWNEELIKFLLIAKSIHIYVLFALLMLIMIVNIDLSVIDELRDLIIIANGLIIE